MITARVLSSSSQCVYRAIPCQFYMQSYRDLNIYIENHYSLNANAARRAEKENSRADDVEGWEFGA